MRLRCRIGIHLHDSDGNDVHCMHCGQHFVWIGSSHTNWINKTKEARVEQRYRERMAKKRAKARAS